MQTKFSDGSIGVCGILPRDAEFKIAGQKNTKICNFSVKIGERDTGGEKPEAIWCNCTCFGQLAEDVKHLKKLDVVFAVGRLERKEYTDKTDGTTKTRTSLICEGIFRGMLPLALLRSKPHLRPSCKSPMRRTLTRTTAISRFKGVRP